MSKLQVGNKVYLKPIYNNARYIEDILNHIKEYEIKKVGRKYFEVWKDNQEWTTLKFHIEDNRQATKYSPDWELYFSKQEIIDEIEHLKLANEIRDSLGKWGMTELSLDQLRRIKTIIDEGKVNL